MEKPTPWEKHPNYNEVIEEVVQNCFDDELMNLASLKTENASQAEALYVILKLKQKGNVKRIAE